MRRTDFDIIVVGAGAAGIPAALFGGDAGARVLLIEAAETIGGTFHISSGQMSAAGSRVQAARGISDTPDDHFRDVMQISRDTADPALVRLAVGNAADTLHWLLDLGLVLEPDHPVIHYGHEPYGIPRTYWAARGGMAILDCLKPAVEAATAAGRIEVRTGTRMTGLLTDAAGAVVGVRLRRGDADADVTARAVILATGGYTADPALFSEMSGDRPLYGGGYSYARGDGLRAAVSIGAQVRNRETYLPTFAAVSAADAPGGYTFLTQTYPQFRQPWEIYVDDAGDRFIREDEPSVDLRERALLALPRMRFWALYDARIAQDAPSFHLMSAEQTARRFETDPDHLTSGSIEDLARRAGIDAGRGARTIQAYNGAILSGAPDPFGRLHRPLPIREPPFYAVRHVGWSIVGFAGLTIDAALRVTDESDRPIPNLYAAGEILGLAATSGNAFAGGMSVTPAMTFGRLLGTELGRRFGISA